MSKSPEARPLFAPPVSADLQHALAKHTAPNPGELTKRLDSLPSDEASLLWGLLEPHQMALWQLPATVDIRSPGGPYETTLEAFRLRQSIAESIAPRNGDFIVDLAGGWGAQVSWNVKEAVRHQPDAKLGYLLIDSNPGSILWATDNSFREAGTDHFYGYSAVKDTTRNLKAIIGKHLPEAGSRIKRLRGAKVYGQYGPLSTLLREMDDLFDAGSRFGLPTDATVVVLNPKFDPSRLRKFYIEEVKQDLKSRPGKLNRIRQAIKDIRSFKGATLHGMAVREHLPIWDPGEIIDTLETAGYRVRETELLHGQTVSLNISRP